MKGIMSCPRQVGGYDSDQSDRSVVGCKEGSANGSTRMLPNISSKRDLEPRLWKAASGAKRPFQSAASSAGVLRDRNDLQLLTGYTDDIPNSFAH
jgi:hypothetical protein